MKTLACLVLFAFSASAQSEQENRFQLGVGMSWLMPTRDFGQFWSKTPAFGGGLKYTIDDEFSLYGGGSVGYFRTAPPVDRAEIPDILFFSAYGETRYRGKVSELFDFWWGAGIGNHTFAFRGSAATLYDQNPTESEFSLHVSAGIDFAVGVNLSLTTRYHHILSYPERLGMWTLSVEVFPF
jgi:hypothetical protein